MTPGNIIREAAVTITRVSRTVSAASLVVFPLSILTYWLLYPAYGLLDSAAVLNAIVGHAARTGLADIFVFTGAFLATPATLALMSVLTARSPTLATIGGAMHLFGWIAIIGVVMGDVITVQKLNAFRLSCISRPDKARDQSSRDGPAQSPADRCTKARSERCG